MAAGRLRRRSSSSNDLPPPPRRAPRRRAAKPRPDAPARKSPPHVAGGRTLPTSLREQSRPGSCDSGGRPAILRNAIVAAVAAIPVDRLLGQPGPRKRNRRSVAGRALRPPQRRQQRRPHGPQLPLGSAVCRRRAGGRRRDRVRALGRYLVLAGSIRFAIEFIRVNLRVVGPLTLAHLLALSLVVIGISLMLRNSRSD